MLELFSRRPAGIDIDRGSRLTPITAHQSVASLSAILLDDAYYEFIQAGKRLVDGLPVVPASHLIPLKARAWIDLTARKEEVDSRDVRKHRNDIIRLMQLLSPSSDVYLPDPLVDDMQKFIDLLEQDESLDVKSLGVMNRTKESIIQNLIDVYGLSANAKK